MKLTVKLDFGCGREIKVGTFSEIGRDTAFEFAGEFLSSGLDPALVFGNESSGLPKDFCDRYRDRLFKIPMPGEHARSINLANAVSIAAYECYRCLTEK